MLVKRRHSLFLFFLPVLLVLVSGACRSSGPAGEEGLRRVVKHDSRGRIKSEVFFKGNTPVMDRQYRRGRLFLETRHLENNIKRRTWYYEDGRISDVRSYKNGRRHGRWAYWHRNGELRSDEYYDNGTLTKKMK